MTYRAGEPSSSKLWAVVSLGLAACAGDSLDADAVTYEQAQETLTITGGTVAHRSGASLQVPAGALSDPTVVSLTGADAPDVSASGARAVGQGFVVGPQSQLFRAPALVTVPYRVEALGAMNDWAQLRLLVASVDGSSFSMLETKVDRDNHLLSAHVMTAGVVVPAVVGVAVRFEQPSVLPAREVRAAEPLVLSVSGGRAPYEWSVTAGALPAGVRLSPNGVVSGAAVLAGVSRFAVEVVDATGLRAQQTFELTVTTATAPAVVRIQPTAVAAGSIGARVTVVGRGFAPGTVARVEGVDVLTERVGSDELRVVVPEEMLRRPGALRVAAATPSGAMSQPHALEVLAPTPVLQAVSPAVVPVGQSPVAVRLLGGGFLVNSRVTVQGQSVKFAWVNAGEVVATVPGSMLANAGALEVQVQNPAPAGGLSARQALQVVVGAPLLERVTPTQLFADQGDVTFKIVGRNFTRAHQVRLGNRVVTPDSVSSTSMAVRVSGPFVEGALSVSVVGANLVSNEVPVTVLPAGLYVTQLSPSTVNRSVGPVTVQVRGRAFEPGASVVLGGRYLITQYVSPTLLEVTLSDDDLVTSGTRAVQVDLNGDLSNSLTFTVAGVNPPAGLVSVSPGVFFIGESPSEVVLTGEKLLPGVVVTVVGCDEAVSGTRVSLTEYRLSLPVACQVEGTLSFVAKNPEPGGGSGSVVSLDVQIP